MSDSRKREPFKALSTAQVAGYLDDKAPDLVCEICANRNWGVIASTFMSLVLRKVHVNTFQEVENVPIQCIECTNCGNLKFFRQAFIKERLEELRNLDLSDNKGE